MTGMLTTAMETALYNWAAFGLPSNHTVIWADQKEQEAQANRPAYPYSTIKVINADIDMTAALRFKHNLFTVTAANLTTTITVEGQACRVNYPASTLSKTAIATALAALINSTRSTYVTATASGETVIITTASGVNPTYVTTPTLNCTVQDIFTHKRKGSFVLSVQSYCRDESHLYAVRQLMNYSEFCASMKILRDAGMGCRGVDGMPRDLSMLAETGSEYIHRAQADFVFGYAYDIDEAIGQVDEIVVTSDITTDKGTVIAGTQTITN